MVAETINTQQFKINVISNFQNIFFHPRKEIHYIGGTDVLPAPLDANEEQKMLEAL